MIYLGVSIRIKRYYITKYRFGINFGPSDNNDKTLIIEQFFTDEDLWYKARVSFSGLAISVQERGNAALFYYLGSVQYFYIRIIVH